MISSAPRPDKLCGRAAAKTRVYLCGDAIQSRAPLAQAT